MTAQDNAVDPALVAEFIDESEEALSTASNLFVELEKNPTDTTIIQGIFRPVHSLKGNAAYFGLLRVKTFAHEMETLLDKLRQGVFTADKNTVSLLLRALDYLGSMLGRVRAQETEVENEQDFESLRSEIRNAYTASPQTALQNGISHAVQALQPLVEKLRTHDTALAEDLAAVENTLTRTLQQHSDTGNTASADTSGTSTQDAASALPPQVQQLQSLLQQQFDKYLPQEHSERVGELLEEIKGLVDDTASQSILDQALDNYTTMVTTVGFDTLLQELLTDNLNELLALDPFPDSTADAREAQSTQAQDTGGDKTPDGKSTTPSASKGHATKTMRVSEESIDRFLEYVGELIVVREMFNYLQKRFWDNTDTEKIGSEFKRINESFVTLSDDLQKSIMNIRKVPIKTIVQKAPRIVRDIASTDGKDIQVQVHGEDLQIDKSYIETLEAPFVHMVRNAADHGIETAQERTAAGKPAAGTISIDARETEDSIELSIQDDGAGLNHEKIRAKAIEKGIIDKNKSMSADAIIDVLFTSGFSTAEKVSDVSGRGVGMDVVKQSIENAKGKIDVSTSPGAGTTFTISLPRNVGTQIINGFLVRAEHDKYIIPIEHINESFQAEATDFNTVAGKGVTVKRRGRVIPYAHLTTLCHTHTNGAQTNRMATVIIVTYKSEQYGIGVDEILGMQQIVEKPVKGLPQQAPIFSGAAITGDGRVAMILDIERAIDAM